MDITRGALPRDLLLSGEHVLWQGRPRGGLMLRANDALLIPFSLLWGGFAVFWNVGVWRDGAPGFFRLWGLPFLLVGLYIVIGRFFVDAILRRGLLYVVTDRRVVIHRKRKTRSLDLARLPVLEMDERRDGSGTLRFGESLSPFGRGGWQVWTPALDPTPQFLRIDHVRAVHALIRQQVV